MARTELDEAFDSIVRATATRLKPLGFRRRGSILRLVRDDMAGLIQFQRSTTNTRELLRFTVNVGVVCGRLLPSGVPLVNATVWDAHVRDRLGHLVDAQSDKWWSIDDPTDGAVLAQEVGDPIERVAVPFIERYMSVDGLRELWESGQSPGLTDGARRDCLARLVSR